MASSKTPHIECHDKDIDIMVYCIEVKDIGAEGFEINADTTSIIREIIPDVVEKCANSSYGKKAILLYNDEDSPVAEMTYCISYYTKVLLYIFM